MELPPLDLSSEHTLSIDRALHAVLHLLSLKKRPLADYVMTSVVTPKPTANPDAFVVRLVLRERVIATLLSKAVATKKSIMLLSENQCGGDAFALCRVLLENLFVVEWLLPQDEKLRTDRIDEYILHFETFKARSDEVQQRHTSPSFRREALSDARSRELANELFEGEWRVWARHGDRSDAKRRKAQVRDLAEHAGLLGLYEKDYFEMSTFIHSAPASVAWDGDDMQHFAASAPTHSDLGRRAAALSNAFMLHMVSLVDSRFSLGLGDWIWGVRMLFVHLSKDERSAFSEVFEKAAVAKEYFALLENKDARSDEPK